MIRKFPPLLIPFLLSPLSQALIFIDGADPPANSAAPTGAYSAAGWQHTGVYRGFHATIISPKHFITARHLGTGGTAFTQPMLFNGIEDRTYTLANGGAQTRIPGTDLVIYEIWETFPDYAEIYTTADEVDRETFITGRGIGRGADITVGNNVVGWQAGALSTGRSRWGRNDILGVLNGGPTLGELLVIDFDNVTGQDECHGANRDSGGGWFIQDGTTWKLAAVNFSVDSGYNTQPDDNGMFTGAIFDGRGLYKRDVPSAGDWSLIPTRNSLYNSPSTYELNPGDIRYYRQTHTYASRISSHQSAINNIIQPAIDQAALSGADAFLAWLEDFSETTNTEQSDDADGDGVSNFLEYFSQSNPTDFSQATPPLSIELTPGGLHQLTVTESLDLENRGFDWAIQVSNDLDTWTDLTALSEDSNTVNAADGNRAIVLSHTPADLDFYFYRLKIISSF